MKNLKKTSYKSKKSSQLVSEGKNLTNLENLICIHQIHSLSQQSNEGAPRPTCRYKVSAGHKVESDPETILKYLLATDKAMKRFRDNDTSLWGWRSTRQR